MAVFPVLLADNQVTRLPSSVEYAGHVEKVFFADDSEQRWVGKIPIVGLLLNFNRITRYDVERIKTFFNSSLGRYDQTWSIAFIDGHTYHHCAFDQDEFPVAEPSDYPQYFSLRLRVRQNITG